MKKKIIIMAVACVMVLTAVIGGTVAAPQYQASKKGNTTINIDDLDVALAGGIEEKVVAVPGQSISFDEYYVSNQEAYDAYVRVTIDKQWDDDPEGELSASVISLNLVNESEWIDVTKDGDCEQTILYFKKPLSAKADSGEAASTGVFLKDITFDKNMDNKYADKSVTITITVDSVQAEVAEHAMLSEWGVKPVFDVSGADPSVLVDVVE